MKGRSRGWERRRQRRTTLCGGVFISREI